MRKKLKDILNIIPEKERPKFNKHLSFSFINALLDLVSVAIIIPLILLILDQEKLGSYFPYTISNTTISNKFIIYLILGVVVVFTLKNIIQLKIIKHFFNYIFNISTNLSLNIAKHHLESNSTIIRDKNITEFYHNIRASCVDFSSKILFSIFSLISESFVLLILFVSSLFLFPLITTIIFGIGLLFSYIIFAIKKKGIMNYNEQYIKYFHENTDQSFNLYNGKLDIILNEAETSYLGLFEKSLENMNGQLATAHYWRFSNTKILELFSILFLIVGVVFYINFQTNYNPFLISFFGAVSFKFLPSFIKLLNAYTEFNAYAHTIKTIQKAKGIEESGKQLINFNELFQLDNISFGYNSDRLILNNIHLSIQPGNIIGIQGNSGIGKTTLLKLIAGLHQSNYGSISIDGQVFSEEKSISHFISYVSQTPYIFKGTILNNIIINQDVEIDLERINFLIDLFELRELINANSKGLSRVLSSDDQSLSTGQKQRLAFVRALYTNPSLLLLDEATSHIEPRLAKKIFSHLQDRAQYSKKAIISVSHNPDLNQYYDKRFILNYEGELEINTN